MRFKDVGHMAIVALHILPLTSHVYALNLDVDNQGKRLEQEDAYPHIFSKLELLIMLSLQ